MIEHSGKITTLSVSKAGRKMRTYKYIKVGERTLYNVMIYHALDAVLVSEIKSDDPGDARIWIMKNWLGPDLIVGIKQRDGETFRSAIGEPIALALLAGLVVALLLYQAPSALVSSNLSGTVKLMYVLLTTLAGAFAFAMVKTTLGIKSVPATHVM